MKVGQVIWTNHRAKLSTVLSVLDSFRRSIKNPSLTQYISYKTLIDNMVLSSTPERTESTVFCIHTPYPNRQ